MHRGKLQIPRAPPNQASDKCYGSQRHNHSCSRFSTSTKVRVERVARSSHSNSFAWRGRYSSLLELQSSNYPVPALSPYHLPFATHSQTTQHALVAEGLRGHRRDARAGTCTSRSESEISASASPCIATPRRPDHLVQANSTISSECVSRRSSRNLSSVHSTIDRAHSGR